jgi:hypothetical protein
MCHMPCAVRVNNVNAQKYLCFKLQLLIFLLLVSFTRMGHSNTRSKEPDQSDANSEPFEENYSFGSFEAPVDLRTYMSLLIYTFPELNNLMDFHTRFLSFRIVVEI